MKTKNTLCLLFLIGVSSACSNSSGTNQNAETQVKNFSIDNCPALAGTYQSEQKTMTIHESRDQTGYQIILGDGAMPTIIDGKVHAVNGSPASYQAWCDTGTLLIRLTQESQSGLLKYSFKSTNTLLEEGSGFENYSTVWRKTDSK